MKKLITFILLSGITFANAQWQKTGGPQNPGYNNGGFTSVKDIIIDGQYMFAATYGKGVFLSLDSGSTWTALNNIGLDPDVLHLNQYNGILYAGGGSAGYMSADSGLTWTELYAFNKQFWQIVARDTMLFASSWNHGVMVSYDQGANWNETNNGLTSLNTENLYLIDNNLYVCTADSGVYRSSDDGATWNRITRDIGAGMAFSIIKMGANLIVTAFPDGTAGGIYISTDNGNSWQPRYLFETFHHLSNLFVLGSYLIASGDSGMYLSADTGKHWRSIDENWTDPGNNWVSCFAANGTTVFAGTNTDTGVWKREIADIKPCNADFTIEADTQLHSFIVTSKAVGFAPMTFNWSWGDGTHDTVPYPVHSYADSGFYDVCLTVKDVTGCISTYCDSSFHAQRTTNTMISASVIPSPDIAPIALLQATDSAICNNACINFKDLSMNATYWEWEFPGGIPSSSAEQNPQNICYTNSGNYDVKLLVYAYNGMDIHTFSNFVNVSDLPITPVITQSNDTLYCSFNPGYVSYQWYKDTVLMVGETNPFLVISMNGNYKVKVTDGNGCSVETINSIILNASHVDQENSAFYLLPNPAHDELIIAGNQNRENARLTIFDVFGKKVNEDMLTQGNSTLNVQNLSTGLYFIQITSPKTIWTGRFVKD